MADFFLMRPLSGNKLRTLRRRRFLLGAWLGRKLKNRRTLTGAERGQQYGLAIGELQGIVMRVRIGQIDLPEASHLATDNPEPGKQVSKRTGTSRFVFETGKEPGNGDAIFCFLFEGNFSAGQQAHSHVWLPDR